MFYDKVRMILMLLLSFSFFSCEQMIFPDFKVTECKRENDSIKMSFSENPDYSSIPSNFLFTENGSSLEGIFSYSGNTISFTPLKKFEEENDYSVTLYTGAESETGISLSENFLYSFTTKTDSSSPEILNVKNHDDDGEIIKTEIQFSKKINQKSFKESFSIIPETEFLTSWNDDGKTCTLIFEEKLKSNVLYTIQISEELKDINNNNMKSSYTKTFINRKDDLSCSAFLYGILNDEKDYTRLSETEKNKCINPEKALSIQFNKPLKFSLIKSGIEIIPEISFSIKSSTPESEYTDKVFIEFNTVPCWNETFSVILNDSIKDDYGRKLLNQEYSITFNSECFRPVDFVCALIETKDENIILSEEENYKDLLLPSDIYDPDKEVSFPVYLLFDISENSKNLDSVSLLEGIGFSVTNSAASIKINSIKNYNAIETKKLLEEEKLSLLSSNGNYSNLILVKVNSVIQSKDRIGLIKIKLSDCIKDSRGNTMKENVVLTANKK